MLVPEEESGEESGDHLLHWDSFKIQECLSSKCKDILLAEATSCGKCKMIVTVGRH